MLKGKTIAVIIPAYNEETQIAYVINTMPDFVDRIVVIDDYSKDHTKETVKKIINEYDNKNSIEIKQAGKMQDNNKYSKADLIVEEMIEKDSGKFTPQKIYSKDGDRSRIILIEHLKNGGGPGAPMASGYWWCKSYNIDCTVSINGDGQMDPSEIEKICMPVVDGEVDYVKANRLSHRSALFVIPKIRYFGNSILSLLTKIASGYWRVSDSQTAFTAISLKALNAIRVHKIFRGYGVPNDILVKLNIAFCTIKEVDSKPVYNIGEKSKMKELNVIPKISWLLFKSFWKRLYFKYLFRDFHPLFLLYHFAFFLLLIDIPIIIKVLYVAITGHSVTFQSLLVMIFLAFIGFQSLIFAMWMDMMDNERLYK